MTMARPKLRVVLMSATINVNTFSKFFNDCPIIQVPGRLYPIDLHYIPLSPVEMADTSDRIDPAPYIRLLRRIDFTYPATERGDLLIFLSGMADIQVSFVSQSLSRKLLVYLEFTPLSTLIKGK
ncbi:unnamed protein product [Trichobilharzia regenti]|nr:unnamed protein product [Trichobilharzia regenti]